MTIARWLHLSDLHLTNGILADPGANGRVLQALLNTVREDGGCFDFIFVTGDLANTGSSSDYQECSLFFNNLCDAAQVDKERIWFVPGNHDVFRPHGRWLVRTPDSEESAAEFFERPAERMPFLSKFCHYAAFAKNIIGVDKFSETDLVRVPEVVSLSANGNFRIGVVPLNTAWFSIDKHDKGKLWVDVGFIDRHVSSLREDGAEVVIALMHHPFDYFHDNDKVAKRVLRTHCDLILRGHLHDPDVYQTVATKSNVVEIAAGATYQTPRLPNRAFICTLQSESRQLRVEPIAFSPGPEATRWVIDPNVFPTNPPRHDHVLLLGRPTPMIADPGPAAFPHRSWESVNDLGWEDAILSWFRGENGGQSRGAYEPSPSTAMNELLEHMVAVLQNCDRVPRFAEFAVKIYTLAAKILEQCSSQLKPNHNQILELFASGVHTRICHLFMLPQLSVNNLLRVDGYSKLLLGTRRHAAGDHDEALLLTRDMSCCIARYVRGQSYRAKEELPRALDEFQQLARELELPVKKVHHCPVTADLRCMCDSVLLNAEVCRALGVIYRRQGCVNEAKEAFIKSVEFIERRDEQELLSESSKVNIEADVLRGEFSPERQRVAADIYYSYGYFLYEENDLRPAGDFFERAIRNLESTGTSWDAPYCRLAVIKFCERDAETARYFFEKAREICEGTDHRINRQAPLSKALCDVGLALIAFTSDGNRINQRYSMLALKDALILKPPLQKGPLICHINDAKKLLNHCMLDDGRNLVRRFISKLEEELSRRRLKR